MIRIFIIFLTSIMFSPVFSEEDTFETWLKDFKVYALKNNISEVTFNKAMKNVTYLPNVIKYDRFQPEFYEDTKTYISKRTSKKKVEKGLKLFKENKNFIRSVEKKFSVESSLLLSLMGIETNF